MRNYIEQEIADSMHNIRENESSRPRRKNAGTGIERISQITNQRRIRVLRVNSSHAQKNVELEQEKEEQMNHS